MEFGPEKQQGPKSATGPGVVGDRLRDSSPDCRPQGLPPPDQIVPQIRGFLIGLDRERDRSVQLDRAGKRPGSCQSAETGGD